MRYFPLFIDLKDRTVIVVGGGEEALRKVRLLLKTEARISIIAESLHHEIAVERRVNWVARRFEPSLLDGAVVVFSVDRGSNDVVAEAAKQRRIPFNAVDNASLSSFIMPSIVDRDPVVVAIGTEGTAPILALGIRSRLEAALPQALGELAKGAGALRQRIARSVPPGSRRRSFWQRYLFGDVRDAFLAGDVANYNSGVEALLDKESAPPSGRVSFVVITSDDPELLTLKAQRKLQEADVIVHDRLIDWRILELARRDAVRISVESDAFTANSAILVHEAAAGRHVVRLLAPAALLDERVSVAAEGAPVETVPGVEAKQMAEVIAFPTRDDIHNAALRAAS